MHMKIDTKQKIRYIRAYLTQLKTNPQTMPFTTLNLAECGFYDYDFVTRRRFTMGEIQKNLKDNKYQTVKQVCQDIKQIFMNVSDYLLLNDPLQDQCVRLIKTIADFQSKFSDEFKQNKLFRAEAKNTKKQDTKASAKDKQDINKDNQKDKQKDKQKEKANDPIFQYNRKSTFAEKLQMFFYLKSHEDNAEYIKSIGQGYNIGHEDQNGDYIIKLQINATTCPWLQLLQKKDQ